jgi:uncharacterized iron-regulated membrane protein
VGRLDAERRVMAVVRRIHGQLLLGERGSWMVELAACWALVMIITGLLLWWPRGRGAAGVLWPRRSTMLRDLHAVTGFWVSGLALVLLLTGLPWTSVWGTAFTRLRAEFGWVNGPAAWSTAASPAGHDHAAHEHDDMHTPSALQDLELVNVLVGGARTAGITPPVVLLAPGASQFDGAFSSPHWVLNSATQDQPRAGSISYDAASGTEVSRERFADRHPIDQVVGYGIAWHEGQLFGPVNQLIGLVTAAALVAMSVTGFMMWRRRRPDGVLGAPPFPAGRRVPWLVNLAVIVLALLLPMLAASLALLWLIDKALPRLSPGAARWLGLPAARRD